MENKERKYGLPLAISMVVGIVIGSGIFFKADDVLILTGGNFPKAIAAWLVGGTAMVFGALVIAQYATKVSKANGLIDYYEYTFGQKSEKAGELAGYICGWYMCIVYYPALIAVVGWVAALYTCVLLGVEDVENSSTTWILTLVYILAIYGIATFSRYISSIIQVSATFIKLIPIALIAVVGVIFGIVNDVSFEATSSVLESFDAKTISFTGAVIATAFAYDGWFLATAINDELSDPKKQLPKALVIGTLIVVIAYIAYFTGIVSTVGVDTVLEQGNEAVDTAANKLFGSVGASILITFIVISCIGTVNGLVMAGARVSYQIATRGHGIAPSKVGVINEKTKTPILSSVVGFVLVLFYVFVWYSNFNNIIGKEVNVTALPVVLNYVFLAGLYILAMIQFKEASFTKRFVFPSLALIGAGIIIYGGFIDDAIALYLILSGVAIVLSLPFFKWSKWSN